MASSKSARTAARERASAARLEISVADYRELKRRIRDMDDPTRFMIVSAFSPRMILYYAVSDDVFCSEPSVRTLFKRKAHAVAVAEQLKNHVQIVEARVRKGKPIKTVSRIRFRFPHRPAGRKRSSTP